MPRKLKIELDLETAQALRTALRPGRTRGADRGAADRTATADAAAMTTSRVFPGQPDASRGSYPFLNMLLRTARAMVQAYDRAARPKGQCDGRRAAEPGKRVANGSIGADTAGRGADEIPQSLRARQAGADFEGAARGRNAEAPVNLGASSSAGSAASDGEQYRGRGPTVINHIANYYAVPAQRRAEAPSEWADGMACT